MAYDEGLAQRVRELLEERLEFNEKKCSAEYVTCLTEIWLVVY